MKQKKSLLAFILIFIFIFSATYIIHRMKDKPFQESKSYITSLGNTSSISSGDCAKEERLDNDTSKIEKTERDVYMNHAKKDSLFETTPHPERVTYKDGFYYEPITDEVKARIYGLSYKEDCTVPYEDLRYVNVLYYNFSDESSSGEIICNKAIAQDLLEIFYELYQNHYPIEKIRLVDEYNADDDLSCADNNTSSFNYRVVEGTTTLSKHALGMAIDINPFYNPYVTYPNGIERISPPGSEPYADRNADLPYMIKKGDLCYNLFIEHGFTWGGEWKSLKDYQHFQKE